VQTRNGLGDVQLREAAPTGHNQAVSYVKPA